MRTITKKLSKTGGQETRRPITGKKAPNRPAPAAEVQPDEAPLDDDQPETLAPGLYLVATPIGNLADLGLRARRILGACDQVVCEDTRVARRLFSAHGLSGRFTAYHDHNAARVRPGILKRLRDGAAVTLISDAGTPLISDPGLKLVRACQEAGVALFTVPGPSAALAALVVSGLPCDRFFFAGFLPPRSAARRRDIESLKSVPASLIFYERAGRLAAALADLAAILGDRQAAVARELTKRYEEVHRDSLTALAAHYAPSPPRGEIVILVGPPDSRAADSDSPDLDANLATALAGHSPRDAAALVARQTGLPKRKVYARAIQLATERSAGPPAKPATGRKPARAK